MQDSVITMNIITITPQKKTVGNKKNFRLIFLFQHKIPICVPSCCVSYEQQFIYSWKKSIKEGVCNFVTTYFTSLHHDHAFFS